MITKTAIVRRGAYQCRILENHLKLGDQQLLKILYICSLLYQNLMVSRKQKSRTDTNTHKKRKSNPNTTLKVVIKSQEKRTKREEKRTTETNPKQLTK